jgi:FkbM family methyltransferase
MIKIDTILSLATDIRAVKALLTWSKFSITSYQMVAGLVKQGILPRTVIDIGANVGQFVIASANLFNDVQIYAFEPVPDSNRQLRKNIVGLENIQIYDLALGDSLGEVVFNINSHSHSSSILPLAAAHTDAFPDAKEIQQITVQVTTLDRVMLDLELRSPTLLKIDAQGYEANILKGAGETLNRIDMVLLEGSFKQMYEGEMLFSEILDLMQERGFRFSRPMGWLVDPRTDEVLQMDALFVRFDSFARKGVKFNDK